MPPQQASAAASLLALLPQRTQERLFVLLHRRVVLAVAAAQVRAQATGVEDRKMQRRPDAGDAASGAEQIQPVQAGGAEARERGEVDVRKEIVFLGADPRRGGLDA